MCYARQDESLTLVPGQLSYTVGSGGDLNTNRPVRIDSAYVMYQGVSTPVTLYTPQQFAAIPFKNQAGSYPVVLYYSADLDSGHLWPWPICNTSGVDLHIITWTPFASFASSTATQTLAPGWQDALCFNLAVVISPEYQAPVSADLALMAKNAKKGIKTVNSVIPAANFDGTLLGNRYVNWQTGTYF